MRDVFFITEEAYLLQDMKSILLLFVLYAYTVVASMPQLVPALPRPYPERMAKDAALKGSGPWGPAIQYWLKEKKLRQAHIVEGTGMAPNKASRAANGLNVRMDTLRQIADFFEVPLESILVSPEHRLSPAEERHVADKVAERVAREIDRGRPKASSRRVDLRLLGIAKRLGKLPPKLQKAAIDALARYEKIAKKPAGPGGGAPPSPAGVLSEAAIGWARRYQALRDDLRPSALDAIEELENVQKLTPRVGKHKSPKKR